MPRAGDWPALLDPGALPACDSALDAIVEALSATGAASGAGPAGGSAGLALLFEGSRDTTLTAELDEVLVEHVQRSPWRREVDLVGGLAGFGLYGVLRHDNEVGQVVIGSVVARLTEVAERSATGTMWFTPAALLPPHQRERFPDGYHNLGLAHGVPGVIGFLAQAAAVGHADAAALCVDAVDWLLAQRLPDGAGATFAATMELADGDTEQPAARSAWCYGDPGVAAALRVAGEALGRDEWHAAAADIALQAARRPEELSGVLDAGICHGAAGLALIFHRFHQATGHPEFASAASAWYTRLLDMRRPGEGVGGYQAWEPPAWVDDPGLLSGAAGVALALLGAGTTDPPDWDRLILLSPTVRPAPA